MDQSYTFRDFKNLNYNLLNQHLSRTDWDNVYHMTSVNDQLIFLESNIVGLYDEIVPWKTKTLTAGNKPWFNASIKDAIQRRNFAYSRWKRFRTLELKAEFRSARKEVNRQIKLAKSEYYSRRFGSALESSQTWKTIRDIGICNKNNNANCSVDADELNKSFTNIPMVAANYNSVDCDTVSYNDDNLIGPSKFEFACVTQDDVISSCNMIKSNAVGYDNIHPKFVKIILPHILPHITHLLNTIIMSSCYPEKWKHAKRFYITK